MTSHPELSLESIHEGHHVTQELGVLAEAQQLGLQRQRRRGVFAALGGPGGEGRAQRCHAIVPPRQRRHVNACCRRPVCVQALQLSLSDITLLFFFTLYTTGSAQNEFYKFSDHVPWRHCSLTLDPE